MSDLSVQTTDAATANQSDERTLRSVLNDEAYNALAAYTATTGLPIAMLEKFKPGLLVSTLQVLEFQSMGFTPQGVDAFFHTRAMGDGKAEGQLETVQEQVRLYRCDGRGQRE